MPDWSGLSHKNVNATIHIWLINMRHVVIGPNKKKGGKIKRGLTEWNLMGVSRTLNEHFMCKKDDVFLTLRQNCRGILSSGTLIILSFDLRLRREILDRNGAQRRCLTGYLITQTGSNRREKWYACVCMCDPVFECDWHSTCSICRNNPEIFSVNVLARAK